MTRGKHAAVRELRRGRTLVVLTVLAMLMALVVAAPAGGSENQPPVAVDDSFTGTEDTTLVMPLSVILSNDYDPDGDTVEFGQYIGGIQHGGTFYDQDLEVFSYEPDPDFCGADSFEIEVTDGNLAYDQSWVFITITCVNDPPVANDDSAITPEDTPVTIDVIANDTDVEGGLDPTSTAVTVAPSHGLLSTGGDGTFTYTPNPDWNGTDLFNYQVCDTAGACDTATVTIDVTPVNDPPVANDDAYSTDEDTPLYVSAPGVLANDSDADGDPLTAVLITDVSNGTLNLDQEGAFQYLPDVDFCGVDTFTYVANDGTVDSNIGTVTITVNCVNDPPVADPNGPYSGVAGEAIVFDGTESSDPEGDPLTFSWHWGDGTPPYGGATPTHVYEPGIFTLCLTVTDPGGLSDTECTTAVVSDPVPIDIDPGSCPNPFNVKAKGVLPVAILGTEDFDVTQVDPASVTLAGVAPLRWSWEDAATPFEPYLGKFDAYDCTASGPDGHEDLSFKFKAQEIAAALGDVNDGDVLVLTLTGNLKSEFGGTPFIGEDVILILSR